MRIGVFGGSFNPPHLGHLLVAESIREDQNLDRVIWIPAATPPHKRREEMLSADHRLEMVRLAVHGNDAFEVSDIELRRGGVSYTLDTLDAFADGLTHEDELFLLVGSDSYRQLETWYRPDMVVERAHLIVYPREAGDLEVSKRFPATTVDAPVIPISATEIRLRIARGLSIRYFVSDAVRRYIQSRGLYTGDEPSENDPGGVSPVS